MRNAQVAGVVRHSGRERVKMRWQTWVLASLLRHASDDDDIAMTHQGLAQELGSAREVVSRLLKYFAGEGIVKLYRGGVEVLDKERLNRIARGEA